MKSFWTGSNDIKILLQKNTFAQQDVTTRNVGINKFEKAEGSPGNSSIENTNENNVTLGKETINPSEFVTLPDDNEPIWNMRKFLSSTAAILPLPDRKESESNFQPIDNVIIGLIVGISIVVFLIIIINCFTFRVYLKETKDDRSFRNGITESSSSRISRNRAGCSPHFIY